MQSISDDIQRYADEAKKSVIVAKCEQTLR